ncbi:AzlC family ABC transporter permease [Mycolicibacterium farcinogenes]|nr:AzlC family ABC transporter permease [Mycolicibacterium farcinogenes]
MRSSECTPTPRSGFRAAASDAAVIWLGLLALGIGFGLVVTGLGLPWWLAPVVSGFVFAGSAEFIIVGMLAGAAPIMAIATATFLVNSRHLFYGLSFPLHCIRSKVGKAYSIYALCDEAYAFAAGKQPGTLSGRRLLWTQAGLHISWAGGALVGAAAGGALLSDIKGLGFILTALFIVLAIEGYRSDHDKTTALLALVSSVISLKIAPTAMLLVAMVTFALTLVARHALVGVRS